MPRTGRTKGTATPRSDSGAASIACTATCETTRLSAGLTALEADLLADDEDETTLVIGHWSYAGTGWATEGERVLAVAAAARAREYDQWKAEQRKSRST